MSGCIPKNFQGYSEARKTLHQKDIKGSQLLSVQWKPYFNSKGVIHEDAEHECTKSLVPEPKKEAMAILQLVACMQSKGFSVSVVEEIILNDRL